MGSTRSVLEKSFYWPYMAQDAQRFVQACRTVQAKKPLSTRHAQPNLFPATTEESQQISEPDAVTRTVRNVPDYDGPRGAEKIQVELKRVPTQPEQPDPLAGITEAVHQTSEQDTVVRTIRSVPDYDGPRGAEKIQVELRRTPSSPGEAPAAREHLPTEEGEQNTSPEGSPLVSGRSEPQPTMRPGPGRCANCLEFWLSNESHPVPCPHPITCHNCRLPGQRVALCPQLTMPGYPEPYVRPPYCYNCLKPGHTVGTCPDLSANNNEKPTDPPACRRSNRKARRRSAILGPRALRIMDQASRVRSQLPLTSEPLAIHQLNVEGDVSNDQSCFCPH